MILMSMGRLFALLLIMYSFLILIPLLLLQRNVDIGSKRGTCKTLASDHINSRALLVALLNCWSVGVLDCWSIGLLECWTVGVLECWSVGMLECWTVGVLDCWSVGLLNCRTPYNKKLILQHFK